MSLEGVYPCEECKDSFFNPYLGRVNQCIDLVEVDILKIFYEATDGDNWHGDTKWTIQDALYCDLEGITCGNGGNIVAIDLKGKGLKGTIPEEIGFLKFLSRLDLSDNYLTGYLPSDLRFAPLRYLDVSNNRMKGIIPHALCRKEGINGNGKNGDFNCENIQCPANTYSSTGRGTCHPCRPKHGTPYIGSKKCSELFSFMNSKQREAGDNSRGSTVVIFFFLFAVFGAIGLNFAVKQKDKEERGEKLPTRDVDSDSDDDDEQEEDDESAALSQTISEEDKKIQLSETVVLD